MKTACKTVNCVCYFEFKLKCSGNFITLFLLCKMAMFTISKMVFYKIIAVIAVAE